MKKLMKNASGSASAAGTEHSKIEEVLQTYETALNGSDAETVKTLFTPDGVFMPQHSPSSIGVHAIHAAYDRIFKTIAFATELQIEEIVQVAPNWAFVRTSSSGFVTVHAIGARVPDANHELFIFQKGDDNAWKIARYCFSTTNPTPQ